MITLGIVRSKTAPSLCVGQFLNMKSDQIIVAQIDIVASTYFPKLYFFDRQ